MESRIGMLLFRLLVLAALWLCWSGSLLAQTFTTLYIFGAGGSPRGTLVEGKDGNLYGRTYGYGGRNNGMIFKITSTGTLTTVYNLNPQNGDGAVPAGLVQHSNGFSTGRPFVEAKLCTISAPAAVARCSVCPFPERLTAAGFLQHYGLPSDVEWLLPVV